MDENERELEFTDGLKQRDFPRQLGYFLMEFGAMVIFDGVWSDL